MNWVYKIKRDTLGNVERYKSRMVAKGYLQKQGIDFKEVNAFVSKHTMLRALLAVVAERVLEVHHGAVAKVKAHLAEKFDVRDLGKVTYFRGMELTRNREARTLKLTQKKRTRELVGHYRLADARARSAPLGLRDKLTKDGEPLERRRFPYSESVGSLPYLSECTRPDIVQAMGALARYMAGPTEAHWQAAFGVVRYLVGTAKGGVTFGGSEKALVGPCDADYARDLETKRSTTE
ncbi:hypothetical protein KFL_012550020 [Klebsormidium nitens]|uniref:Reverse transcriptase Ty1/copia-type domain-containing protein n=1 Tax=Klebsormidium nitens TaxID=105231 RepID=A0A1Y1IQ86_KLENI|nr:hypothetical protein KFL_012550020 [Klebsormidium nitens]|eukprot:GAQ93020.1 hypothetical protein KFL_012550020 [Klebsormidium nitens]